jgi:hypothetical protein
VLGERLAASHSCNHLGALPRRQAVEVERSDMRPTDPGRGELRTEGDDQQKRQRRYPVDDQVQQLERGRVTPLRVLEQHQQRLPNCQSFDLRHERLESLLLLLLWREVERRVALAGR